MSLVNYYRLNETSGTTAVDSEPTSPVNGTYAGTPLLNQIPLVKADINAKSVKTTAGVVNLGTRTDLAALTRWSIECWCRPDVAPTGSGLITSEYGGITTVFFELGCGADGTTDDKFMVGFFNGSWAVARDTISPTLGAIYHVVGTWDGTTLRLYRDGNLVASNVPSIGLPSSVGVFYLGRRHDTGVAQYPFPGWMSECAIYDDALTAAEVRENYRNGAGQAASPNATNLSGNWTPVGVASLHLAIDEDWPLDTDYMQSGYDPASADVTEVALAALTKDPATGVGHIIRYRYEKESGLTTGNRIDLTVRLMEGSTQRAAWSHADIGAVVNGAHELTVAEADAIGSSAYTTNGSLRLKFEAVKV